MKEQVLTFLWIFKYCFHIVFVCLLKLLIIYEKLILKKINIFEMEDFLIFKGAHWSLKI